MRRADLTFAKGQTKLPQEPGKSGGARADTTGEKHPQKRRVDRFGNLLTVMILGR